MSCSENCVFCAEDDLDDWRRGQLQAEARDCGALARGTSEVLRVRIRKAHRLRHSCAQLQAHSAEWARQAENLGHAAGGLLCQCQVCTGHVQRCAACVGETRCEEYHALQVDLTLVEEQAFQRT